MSKFTAPGKGRLASVATSVTGLLFTAALGSLPLVGAGAATDAPAATPDVTSSPEARLKPPVITVHGFVPIRLGMSPKAGLGTGYYKRGDGYCDLFLREKGRWQGVFETGFAHKSRRISELLARTSEVQTRQGTAVGSSVAQVQAAHPALEDPRLIDIDAGEQAWIQRVHKERDSLVFLYDTDPSATPADEDSVRLIIVIRDWRPRRGLYGGC